MDKHHQLFTLLQREGAWPKGLFWLPAWKFHDKHEWEYRWHFGDTIAEDQTHAHDLIEKAAIVWLMDLGCELAATGGGYVVTMHGNGDPPEDVHGSTLVSALLSAARREVGEVGDG